MSMNQTPMSERVHIGFFGRRKRGKIKCDERGDRPGPGSRLRRPRNYYDPVYKSMELLPLGPVVMMDTPGIDDEGALGALRVKKSWQVLNKTDVAVPGDRRQHRCLSGRPGDAGTDPQERDPLCRCAE